MCKEMLEQIIHGINLNWFVLFQAQSELLVQLAHLGLLVTQVHKVHQDLLEVQDNKDPLDLQVISWK